METSKQLYLLQGKVVDFNDNIVTYVSPSNGYVQAKSVQQAVLITIRKIQKWSKKKYCFFEGTVTYDGVTVSYPR